MTAVRITDVFLRDGLQDEDVIVPTERKLAVLDALLTAGVRRAEVASFVNPARVPQMGDATEIYAGLPPDTGAEFTCLALNGKGIARAVAAGATSVGIVTSASEAHSNANAGARVEDAINGLLAEVARHPQVTFAAGISTAFICPFEGQIDADRLVRLAAKFVAGGVTRIGLADTIGTASTELVLASLEHLRERVEADYSLHLHNANGQALDTVLAAVDAGITAFDSAIGGYGGCPFAPGAHGNLATEELVGRLHAAGHSTGIDPGLLDEAVTLAREVVAGAPSLTH